MPLSKTRIHENAQIYMHNYRTTQIFTYNNTAKATTTMEAKIWPRLMMAVVLAADPVALPQQACVYVTLLCAAATWKTEPGMLPLL